MRVGLGAHCIEDGLTLVTPYDYDGGPLQQMELVSIEAFAKPSFAQRANNKVDQVLALDHRPGKRRVRSPS